MTTFEATDATFGFEDVKDQNPGDVDAGGFSERLTTLSFIMVMSPKVPTTGTIALIVIFIDALADFQFGVRP